MSYDIYCYKSKIGKPNEDEADSVIEADNDKWAKKDKNSTSKLALVKNLLEFDTMLEAKDFKYGDISKLSVDIIEENEKQFARIEINTLESDLTIQLSVFDNHVFITLPFTYKGDEAKKIFERITSYVKIINETAGYFVFDPQTGQVFDPAENEFDGLLKYLSVSENYL
jgi:hypothetical protein